MKRRQWHEYQRDALVKCIYRDIINGYTYVQICDRVRKDVYELGFIDKEEAEDSRFIEAMILLARKLVREDFEQEREGMKEKLVTIAHDVLRSATEKGDNKHRLAAIKEIANLTGSYEPEKVEQKVEQIVEIDFNFNTDFDNEG